MVYQLSRTSETSGGLLIETLNDQQGARLLMMKKIGDIKVEVSSHTALSAQREW